MGTLRSLLLVSLMCCFVVMTRAADGLQWEQSGSRTYADFLTDVSMKVHHASRIPDQREAQLAGFFADAVYDALQPVQRFINVETRKRLFEHDLDEQSHLLQRETGDNDGGAVILRKLLNNLEHLYSRGDGNVTSKCVNDTGRLIIGLLSSEPWAIQFLDSTGKPGPALTKLHLNFVGDYGQCKAVTVPAVKMNATRDIYQEQEGFDGNYCVVKANLGNPYIIPQIGVCMPSTCTSQDVTNIVNGLAKITIKIPVIAECLTAKTEMTTATVFAIIILTTIGIMMLLGTFYDLITASKKKEELPINSIAYQNGHPSVRPDKDITNGEATPLLSPSNEKSSLSHTESPSALGKVLLAFSVYSNGKKILNTSQAPGSLGVIHGIRFLSMSWVVLCHFYSHIIAGLNGNEVMSKWVDRWTFLPISNGFPSVDTFFTLSGLLTSYLTIKEMSRKNSWNINWPMFYFHRFWRLTPPYMFAIVIVLGLTQYFGQGPLWPNVQPSDKKFCESNWWTNLLYVNNLVHSDKMCFGHSWYLANDMQFFVLSPLMLVPFYFHRFAGMVSCFVFLMITTITTGVLSSQNDWPTTMVSFKNTHTGAKYWFSDYYIKPWCRIGPFIVGILAGYILAQTKGRPFRMPWYIALTGWIAAFAEGLAVVYGLWGDISGYDISTTGASALYNAMARSVWGACVSWVIIACSAGYGGPVQTLLSWSPFVVLGRLTYMSYLVHLCILGVFFNNLGALLYINDTTVVIVYLGLLLFVNMVSFVLVLALESPMVGLERAFLRGGKKS